VVIQYYENILKYTFREGAMEAISRKQVAGQPRFFPGKGKIFFLLHNVNNGSGLQSPILVLWITSGSFFKGKTVRA
jgi:hypothetical protein